MLVKSGSTIFELNHLIMDKTDDVIYDFSNLTANEIEVETCDNIDAIKTNAKPKSETPFFEPFDYTNGAIYEEKNYCWSQTFSDIGIYSGIFFIPNLFGCIRLFYQGILSK